MIFDEKVRVFAETEISVLKDFPGRPYEQMPLLIRSGRQPLHMKGGMERRLGKIGTQADAKTLQDNYFTSANLMVRNTHGEVVVAAYENNAFAREVALSLDKGTIEGGSLVRYNGMDSDELFDVVKAGGAHIVLSAKQAINLNSNGYAEPKVRAQVWEEAFAEGDTNLDSKYGKLVDTITGRNFKSNRGLWVPVNEGGRLVWLGSVGSGSSYALGYNYVDGYGGVLVGVGDGVASAGGADVRDNIVVAPTLEQTLGIFENRDLSENDKVNQLTALYRQ